MKTTAINALSYPEDSDAPDGPTQIKDLAEDLDVVKWGSRNIKLTSGVVASSSAYELSGSYGTPTGASLEITPAVASIMVVTCIWGFAEGITGGSFEGSIKVDAEAEKTPAMSGVGEKDTQVVGVYQFALTAAPHTIALRAKRFSGEKGKLWQSAGARFLYELWAS